MMQQTCKKNIKLKIILYKGPLQTLKVKKYFKR